MEHRDSKASRERGRADREANKRKKKKGDRKIRAVHARLERAPLRKHPWVKCKRFSIEWSCNISKEDALLVPKTQFATENFGGVIMELKKYQTLADGTREPVKVEVAKKKEVEEDEGMKRRKLKKGMEKGGRKKRGGKGRKKKMEEAERKKRVNKEVLKVKLDIGLSYTNKCTWSFLMG